MPYTHTNRDSNHMVTFTRRNSLIIFLQICAITSEKNYLVKKIIKKVLTLKAPRKMHLKISSAEAVCCKYLPNITGEFMYTSKKCGPRTDCSYRRRVAFSPAV